MIDGLLVALNCVVEFLRFKDYSLLGVYIIWFGQWSYDCGLEIWLCIEMGVEERIDDLKK